MTCAILQPLTCWPNEVDLLTVYRRLGHIRASTTLDTYAHLVPGAQENAASVMDEITIPAFQTFSALIAPGLHQEANKS